MLFPNKLFSYRESIISKFPIALNELQDGPMTVSELYKVLNKHVSGVSEFLDLMDCLYAMNAIELDEEEGALRCVKGNCV